MLVWLKEGEGMGRWGGSWHDWQYALGARRERTIGEKRAREKRARERRTRERRTRERRIGEKIIGERRRTGLIWIMEYSW